MAPIDFGYDGLHRYLFITGSQIDIHLYGYLELNSLNSLYLPFFYNNLPLKAINSPSYY